jgi:hypothetical protein
VVAVVEGLQPPLLLAVQAGALGLVEALQAHLVLAGRAIKAATTISISQINTHTRRLLAVAVVLEPLEETEMGQRQQQVLAVRVQLAVLRALQ